MVLSHLLFGCFFPILSEFFYSDFLVDQNAVTLFLFQDARFLENKERVYFQPNTKFNKKLISCDCSNPHKGSKTWLFAAKSIST